jgi:hypothetical protein
MQRQIHTADDLLDFRQIHYREVARAVQDFKHVFATLMDHARMDATGTDPLISEARNLEVHLLSQRLVTAIDRLFTVNVILRQHAMLTPSAETLERIRDIPERGPGFGGLIAQESAELMRKVLGQLQTERELEDEVLSESELSDS